MKIGLIDVDGHNWPNLALMKLSSHHKAAGDQVEWWNGLKTYDLVYQSRVFDDTYSKDLDHCVNADKVIKGGTGYNLTDKLPSKIEHIYPDYDLYNINGTAYGYLTRGCPRNCPFCIVSKKEGRRSKQVADLTEFWRDQKEIKLLDPNLLAAPEHETLLQQLAESGAWIDFTQGVDIRLTTPDNIALLNKVKTDIIHFAWDDPIEDLTEDFKRFNRYTKLKGSRKKAVYVLTNFGSTHKQDLERVYMLRSLNYDPYIMIYNKPKAPHQTRKLQRWVNNKIIFNTVQDFKDYDCTK